jgi:hypothetical protein
MPRRSVVRLRYISRMDRPVIPDKTHYEVLKIAADASADEVRAAYRRLSRRFHPDRHPRHPDAAARIMAAVNVAYDVLSDERRRADYDHFLRNPEHGQPQFGPAPRRRPARATVYPAPASVHVPPAAGGAGPAPFFGVHDHRPPPAHVRRLRALRRLIAASALACTVAVALGAWLLLSPPAPAAPAAADVARLVQAHQARAAVPVAATSAPATPIAPVHVRPLEAPNGTPWPAITGDVAGYPRRFSDGQSVLLLDNRLGSSDVFVRVYRVSEQGLQPARHLFVRARERFLVEQLSEGAYEVRYLVLDSGRTLGSPQIPLAGREPGNVYRVDAIQGRDYAIPIAAEEFQTPALQLKLSQQPSLPSTVTR